MVRREPRLSSVSPAIQASFGQASTYYQLPVNSGGENYEVYFTQVGVPTFTYMDTGPISFGSGQNRTIVGLNSLSGGQLHLRYAQRSGLIPRGRDWRDAPQLPEWGLAPGFMIECVE